MGSDTEVVLCSRLHHLARNNSLQLCCPLWDYQVEVEYKYHNLFWPSTTGTDQS